MTPKEIKQLIRKNDAEELKGWQTLALCSVFSMMFLLALFAALSGRTFFADGAYAMVHFLNHPHEFWILDQPRAIAQYIMQTPILVAEKLNLASAKDYSIAFAIGTFFIPITLYAIAAYTVRNYFARTCIVVITAVFLIYSINYIITELNLLCALVILCAAILSTYENVGKLTIILFLSSSLAATRVHEGMLFSAPILAVWSYLKLTSAPTAEHKAALLLAILAFSYAFFIALASGLAPRDPTNASGFIRSFGAFFSSPQLYLGLCCVTALMSISSRNSISILFFILTIAFSIVFICKIVELSGYYAYSVYYRNRAFVSLAAAGCIGLLFVVSKARTPIPSSATTPGKWIIILIPVLAIIVSDSIGTMRWRTYVASFCTLLNDSSGLPQTAETLEREGFVTGWSWNHPSLSVLLRQPGSAAVVVNYPHPAWQPTIPLEAGFPTWQSGLCPSPTHSERGQ